MYKGFRFDLTQFDAVQAIRNSQNYSHYLESQNNNNLLFQNSIDKYLTPGGEINVEELCDDWFKQIDADVFLSHSHKDDKAVQAFAAYLSQHGLRPFVDANVWGYANSLIDKLDDKYYREDDKNYNGKLYNHKGSNYVASQVYLILNNALMKMIDKTECVIFLETPNSIEMDSMRDKIDNVATNSVWIYSEMMGTRLIKKHPVDRIGHSTAFSKRRLDEAAQAPVFRYDMNLDHLPAIGWSALRSIIRNNRGTDILDELYARDDYERNQHQAS